MKRMAALAVVAATLLLEPDTASAANKEQQLLMAELRMMQQHQQVLQQSLGALADALKLVNGKIDDQAATSRKALADQRLLIEGMTDTVRVLRERSDDANVRLSSITQELESIRQTIAALPPPAAVVSPAGEPADPGTAGIGTAPATPAGAAPVPAAPSNMSPQRTYESAYSDYTAGSWELAVVGFQTFLKFFPRHSDADNAQLNIGNSLYNAGRMREATSEYQRVISDHPRTESVPAAYYKLGLSYRGLKQEDLARKAFETVIKDYPGSPEATFARQALVRTPK